MCGIAGYIGNEVASKKIFDMLKRLEYRGYDSAGVAVLTDKAVVFKDFGRVDDVKKNAKLPDSKIGIGHTRWATHGEPNKINAHPHVDCKSEIVIVHNGIIENYLEIKKSLPAHKFESETDTEVIAHLIEENMTKGLSFENSFREMLNRIIGSFAIVAVSSKDKEKILVAKNESPLILGVKKGEKFVASDIPAMLADTRDVVILEDMEWAVVEKDKIVVRDIKTNKIIPKKEMHVDMEIMTAEKSGYEHFMLKEIMEEPDAVKNAMRDYDNIKGIIKKYKGVKKVCFIGCGTAHHAGLVGRIICQELGIDARADVSSEFRYSGYKVPVDLVVAVSQSGETSDTVAAAKKAKESGMKVIAVVNVVGSTLDRLADDTIHTYTGPEIAVASTKAYIGQLVSVILFTTMFAKEKGIMKDKEFSDIINELKSMPEKIDSILSQKEAIRNLAEENVMGKTFLFIGRGIDIPTAMEGALKLKEISYKHAEAYPAGELKHGPLALLEPGVKVIGIIPKSELEPKMLSNIQEARSREADVITVSMNTYDKKRKNDNNVLVPETKNFISPILLIVPLHLFAYYTAVILGHDIDKPRNLAKSVTVE